MADGRVEAQPRMREGHGGVWVVDEVAVSNRHSPDRSIGVAAKVRKPGSGRWIECGSWLVAVAEPGETATAHLKRRQRCSSGNLAQRRQESPESIPPTRIA